MILIHLAEIVVVQSISRKLLTIISVILFWLYILMGRTVMITIIQKIIVVRV